MKTRQDIEKYVQALEYYATSDISIKEIVRLLKWVLEDDNDENN